jgi:hypothetical protein
MFKQVFRGPLSETATVASQLGTPGEWRADASGNLFRLFQVGSITLGPCAAVFLDSTSGSNGFRVEPATLVSYGANGFANQINSTQAYATGVYFWAQVYGIGSVNHTNTCALGSHVYVTAAGKVITAAQTIVGAVARPLNDATGSTPALAQINCLKAF